MKKLLLLTSLLGLISSAPVESSRIDLYATSTCKTHVGYRSDCGKQPLSRDQVYSASVKYDGQTVYTYSDTACNNRIARYDNSVDCVGSTINCVCIDCGPGWEKCT